MIRNLLIIAGASFVLMLGCAAGVAALAGPTIVREGWTIPFDDDDVTIRGTHLNIDGAKPAPTVTRELAWSGEALIVDLPLDVTYVQGPAAKVEISGPQAFVDRLRLENGRLTMADQTRHDRDLHGESLTIDGHGIRIHSNADQISIVITAPNVTQFQVDGSGDLEIRDYNQSGLTLAINGSGEIDASGKTQSLVVATSGSGDANLEELRALNAEVSISGSGDADISATNQVKIAISGSGDVNLQTQPISETSSTSGSGSVRHNF